jgi:rod shape determining protein RodA
MIKSFFSNEWETKLSGMKTIIFCLLFLNFASLIAIYSSLHQNGILHEQTLFYKQIIWILVSWGFLFIFSFINYKLYYDFVFVIYILNVILLIAVFILGREAMGAQRWISFGGFSFQPSELSKFSTIILLSRFFAMAKAEKKNFIRDVFFPLVLVGFNFLLIFKQPDLGTGLLLLLLFFMIGIFSNLKKRYFILLMITGFILIPFTWTHLKDYQKKRLTVFIDPAHDPLGAGYTIIQSKIAIGSGKLLGKGFLSGTQNQFNFLPERHTDFIFTVIAEEWGFAGSTLLLFVYWLLLSKIIDRIKNMNDNFAQLLAVGISSLFFLHIFINMGMTLGILPVVGIPLLFLSYGGTHIMTSYIFIGIFFNICRND